jgi:hypothetical protein
MRMAIGQNSEADSTVAKHQCSFAICLMKPTSGPKTNPPNQRPLGFLLIFGRGTVHRPGPAFAQHGSATASCLSNPPHWFDGYVQQQTCPKASHGLSANG